MTDGKTDEHDMEYALLSDSRTPGSDTQAGADPVDPVPQQPAGTDWKTDTKTLLYASTGTTPLRAIKTLVPFVSSIMLARMGAVVAASTTIINTVENFSSIIFNAPLFFVPTVVGEALGKKDFPAVGKETQAGWVIALLYFFPQYAVMSYMTQILSGLDQPDQVVTDNAKFFDIYRWSVLALSIMCVTDQVVQTTGHFHVPVLIHLAGWATCLFISAGLGFGTMGMPDLGLEGVAWGLLARSVFNLVVTHSFLLYSTLRKGKYHAYKLFSKPSGFFKSLLRQILNGYGLLIAFASMMGATFLINVRLGSHLGSNALHAQLVPNMYQEFIMVPAIGFGAAAQMLAANQLKRENAGTPSDMQLRNNAIYHYGTVAGALSMIIPTLYLAMALLTPKTLIRPFFDPNAADSLAATNILVDKRVLFVGAMTSLLKCIHFSVAQALMGADKVGFPILIGLLFDWTSMALVYGFANTPLALNLFVALGELLATATAVGYWQYCKNKFVIPESEKKPSCIQTIHQRFFGGGRARTGSDDSRSEIHLTSRSVVSTIID